MRHGSAALCKGCCATRFTCKSISSLSTLWICLSSSWGVNGSIPKASPLPLPEVGLLPCCCLREGGGGGTAWGGVTGENGVAPNRSTSEEQTAKLPCDFREGNYENFDKGHFQKLTQPDEMTDTLVWASEITLISISLTFIPRKVHEDTVDLHLEFPPRLRGNILLLLLTKGNCNPSNKGFLNGSFELPAHLGCQSAYLDQQCSLQVWLQAVLVMWHPHWLCVGRVVVEPLK